MKVGWAKDVVQWRVGGVLYLSVVFTWLLPRAAEIAKEHKGRVIAGGPAIDLMGGVPWAETPGRCDFDVLAMHNPLATFTTRGCPRSCGFCAVPKIEGEFRELHDWKIAPIVCDNNFLASSPEHIEDVIECLERFPCVDFNQGLDARLFSEWHAQQFQRLQRVKLRFSLDSMKQVKAVEKAIGIAHDHGFTARDSIGVYVLVGHHDTPDDARERLELVRSWGHRPNPMRFQPLDVTEKNAYVAPGWNEYELRRMAKYYSRLAWYGGIPYDEFVSGADPKQTRMEIGGNR